MTVDSKNKNETYTLIYNTSSSTLLCFLGVSSRVMYWSRILGMRYLGLDKIYRYDFVDFFKFVLN